MISDEQLEKWGDLCNPTGANPWHWHDFISGARAALPQAVAELRRLHYFSPTPENIAALPRPLRQYISELESKSEHGNIVQENSRLRGQCVELERQRRELQEEYDSLARLNIQSKEREQEATRSMLELLEENQKLKEAAQWMPRAQEALAQCALWLDYEEFIRCGYSRDFAMQKIVANFGEVKTSGPRESVRNAAQTLAAIPKTLDSGERETAESLASEYP